jgi:tagatose 6-phosphate kinase
MILVVGLSAVWQRTLFFDALDPGTVNRARRVLETASGKGVNVARVAATLGADVRVLTVAGGHRGELFRRALRADGVDAIVIPVRGETRVCQTLIGVGEIKSKSKSRSGGVTELVEEAPGLRRSEVEATVREFARELGRVRMVVLSGTVPPGCGANFYGRLARLAEVRGVPVVVDAQREQLLNVVGEGPVLVKVNRAELAEATGQRAVAAGVRRLGVTCVVISDGAKPVSVFEGQERWSVQPVRVKAVNPIGSGDAMLAGMVTALWRGESLREAVRWGMACGAANALTATSGVVRREDVRRLWRGSS